MPKGMQFEKRMSDADALMWNIEKDPMLRSTITAVTLLDQAPDRDRIMERMEWGTCEIPRLRQRVVGSMLSLAPPRWATDPGFDLDYHVRFVKAPGDGTMRDLLDLAQPIAMQGFDRARPLWEFTVVDGLEDGRAAMIQKIHHSMTDGVGGMQIAMLLVDLERDPADGDRVKADPPELDDLTPMRRFLDAWGHVTRRQQGRLLRLAKAAPKAAVTPGRTTRSARDTVASILRLTQMVGDPLSPIMQGRSIKVQLDTMVVPLEDAKAAARKVGGKLNDAFVAGVAGGLRRYHEHHGRPVDELRMNMPVNIRTDNTAGNAFAPTRFLVPVGIEDPKERMTAIHALVDRQRSEPALAYVGEVSGLLNQLPTSVLAQVFGSMLKGVDFTTSNVPGSPIAGYMAGARIDGFVAFGPLAGVAANITLLSYVGDLHLGIVTDAAAVPDPAVFTECLREGFDEVLKA